MFKKQDLENLLKESNWPEESKAGLLAIVPLLGQNTLNFLYKEVDTFFSEIISEDIVKAFTQIIASVKDAPRDPSQLLTILRQAPDSPKFEFGKYLVPVIADARSILSGNKTITDAILEFELKLFKELPESELQEIIKEHLLYFMSRLNVAMEFKRINYNRRIGESKIWGRQYIVNLENNQELFSKGDVYIEGKKYPGQIKNWIRDFIVALPVPVSERTTFEEVQYLKRSLNASKLTAAEQQQLLEIIKLYRWFLDPFVTEEEVAEYEQKLNDVLYKEAVSLPEPEVPKKQGFGFKKPMDDVAAMPPVLPRPLVLPPLKATPASVQEILSKKLISTHMRAPGGQPKPVVQQISTSHADVKKSPISSISDILMQKKELEKKIDEKIEDLKKRTVNKS